jgi:hypothetical protein
MFPNVIYQKRNRYFFRSAIERYKADLAGIPFQPNTGPDPLVPFKVFAAEMGVCQMTIERRLAEARNAAAEAA